MPSISICSSSSLLWHGKIFLNYVDFYWFVVRYCTYFSSTYTGINSENYSLLGCNLKNCSALESCLLKCGLNTSSVTLLLSEVVLTYLNPPKRYQASNASIKTIECVSDFMLFESFVLSNLIAKERNSSKRKMEAASSCTSAHFAFSFIFQSFLQCHRHYWMGSTFLQICNVCHVWAGQKATYSLLLLNETLLLLHRKKCQSWMNERMKEWMNEWMNEWKL